jgi:hypothetical protein
VSHSLLRSLALVGEMGRGRSPRLGPKFRSCCSFSILSGGTGSPRGLGLPAARMPPEQWAESLWLAVSDASMGLLPGAWSLCLAVGRVLSPLCRSLPETAERTGELLRERLAAEQARERAPMEEFEPGLVS